MTTERPTGLNRAPSMRLGLLVILMSAFTLASSTDSTADDHSPTSPLTLPQVFSDHMVLQRNIRIPIWGKATPGQKITVKFWKAKAETNADRNGRWIVRLDKMPANSKPGVLTVTGKTAIVFRDVLVGDVWLCSGQSNMGMYLGQCHNASSEVPNAQDPQLRLFRTLEAVSPRPEDDVKLWNGKRWQRSTPDAAKSFSAVGYFFGRELRKELRVPIGIINSSQGGSKAQLWISTEALAANADAYPDFRHWLNKRKEVLKTNSQKLPEGREFGPYSDFMVGNLYNAMIAPLVPYGLRGMVWYQGESNEDKPKQYAALLPILIADWRSQWQQGPLPFLIVQLPNISNPATAPVQNTDRWPWIREAQAQALRVPNTAMAVTIDIGEASEVHCRDKMDVGIRLALAARRLAYRERLVASGPAFRKLTIGKSSAWLEFDHVGSGLTIGVPPWTPSGNIPAPGNELTGFAVAGANKTWYPAQAHIEQNRVVVSSEHVPTPVAVRYGWANNPKCNLYNKEKLPAAPFRTDNW